MSGTTTSGGSSARVLDLGRLRDLLRAKPGRARGRTADQDVSTALSRLRRVPGMAPLVRGYESGGTLAVTAAQEQALTDMGVSAADLTASVVAPASTAGTSATTASGATGTLTLAATNGTATVAVPGQALTAPAAGYVSEVVLQAFDPTAGTVTVALVNVSVKRPSGAASAVAGVVNRIGTDFGAPGTAGITLAVTVACAADGATATLTLTNSGPARALNYAVRRLVG